jgi:uncharacterized protein
MWTKLLQPDWIVGDSVLALTPEFFTSRGIAGLILDVDDTILPIATTTIEPAVVAWIEAMRAVTAIWLVSNNVDRQRIGNLADSLNLPGLPGAAKPSCRKLRQAVDAMELSPERVATIGDRIFTDVLAGNRLGAFTILVDPIVKSDSSTGFHALRQVEFTLARACGVRWRD